MTDSSGLPAPKIDYHLHPNDRRMMDFAIDRAVDLVQACDAWDIKINRWDRFGRDYAPPAFHLYGTCRMGVDPETSVTNEFGQILGGAESVRDGWQPDADRRRDQSDLDDWFGGATVRRSSG